MNAEFWQRFVGGFLLGLALFEASAGNLLFAGFVAVCAGVLLIAPAGEAE